LPRPQDGTHAIEELGALVDFSDAAEISVSMMKVLAASMSKAIKATPEERKLQLRQKTKR
jgi:hypothetical protein